MTAWIEWQDREGRRRETLRPGLTVLGGDGADVRIDGADDDLLHLWDDPPKVVALGGDPPEVAGMRATEASLRPGDVLHWKGLRILYGEDREAPPKDPVLVEIPLDRAAEGRGDEGGAGAPARSSPAGAARTPEEERAWTALRAGLLVELGLADPGATRRWQTAVTRGEFDAELAAAELGRASLSPDARQRLADRSARLFRDLVMAPVQRGLSGTSRRVRTATKGGVAFVVAQGVTLVVYTLLIGVAALLARVRWDWSFDGFFDRVRDALPG